MCRKGSGIVETNEVIKSIKVDFATIPQSSMIKKLMKMAEMHSEKKFVNKILKLKCVIELLTTSYELENKKSFRLKSHLVLVKRFHYYNNSLNIQ